MEESEMVALYQGGMGTMRLSQEAGLHRMAVQRVLLRNGVSLRKKSPQAAYDVGFFSTYRPDSVYWAGFILADGCLRSDRATLHIKLASRDRGHLAKFARVLGLPESTVKDRSTYSHVDVNGTWFPKDLERQFGITPRKTWTVHFPEQVPEKLQHHLVRGVFDGDGCISRLPGGIPQVSFAGTEGLLNSLRELFYDVAGVRLKSKNRVAPLCYTPHPMIAYSGRNAMRILDWIYTGSEDAVRLERKYERYLEAR